MTNWVVRLGWRIYAAVGRLVYGRKLDATERQIDDWHRRVSG